MRPLRKLLILLSFIAATQLHAQVPLHQSHPASPMVIYLDFDGHYLNGTSWNMWGPITLAPSGLTSAQMTEIFHRMAEDFRPFNLNITTDSTGYWNAPANGRMRMIFTTSNGWYGNVAGTSYMGSFTWGDNTPAFVFPHLLSNNTKSVAEAASHETGHTLGLRHQSTYNNACVKTAEYNSGAGAGDIGWAPIMGVGYYKNVTQWNIGTDPLGCNSFQNDLQIITTVNGFDYRSDDFTDDPDITATPIPFNGNNEFTIEGIIERPGDIDVIRINVPAYANFVLEVVPFNLGSGAVAANLDAEVLLMNASGQILSASNPAEVLYAEMDTNLFAGTYYIMVRGRGNVYAPDYASLGSYRIDAQLKGIEGGILPVRNYNLSIQRNGNTHRLNWTMEADEAVLKQIVQVSVNGDVYKNITTLDSNARSFVNKGDGQNVRYRLRAETAGSKWTYSNIVSVKGEGRERPAITVNATNLSIESTSVSQFHIVDMNGRRVASGRVNPGKTIIPLHSVSAGMYLIEFLDKDWKHSQKFIKR